MGDDSFLQTDFQTKEFSNLSQTGCVGVEMSRLTQNGKLLISDLNPVDIEFWQW